MKDDLKREIKGKMDNIKGRVKEAMGALSGNKERQAEGTVERVEGAAKEKVAEAERKFDGSRDREEADDE
ncbi:MAG TPA: CsbD family protein [Polyangia bacterium]|nr:CsbD family protein [Polyangia bacterium]